MIFVVYLVFEFFWNDQIWYKIISWWISAKFVIPHDGPCDGDKLHDHAGEAIIMLLGNYENFANVVAENIIKTRCIRIKWSMCIIYNQFWIHRLSNLQE